MLVLVLNFSDQWYWYWYWFRNFPLESIGIVSNQNSWYRMDRNYLLEKFFPATLKKERLSAIHPIVSKLASCLDKMEQNLDKTLWLTQADAMLRLMNLALKCKESEIANFQNQKASFRLYEGLAEAAPQSLLQSSIQIRDDKFFNQNTTITDMVTVILSVVSLVSASATMYEFSSEYV